MSGARINDPRLLAACARIPRGTRKLCSEQLTELCALSAQIDAGTHATLIKGVLLDACADQIALALAMARLHATGAQLLGDIRDVLPDGLADDDPALQELAVQAKKLAELLTEAQEAYIATLGRAALMQERGYRLVTRIKTTTRSYRRARVAVLERLRSLKHEMP